MLDLGGVYADGGVEGRRAFANAAGDLAAVGHLAELCSFHGGRDLRIHGFNGKGMCDRSHHGVELRNVVKASAPKERGYPEWVDQSIRRARRSRG